MSRDDLQKRIAEMNRQPLNNVPNEEPADPTKEVVYSRGAPRERFDTPRFRSTATTHGGSSITLEEVVEGIPTTSPGGCDYYHIEKSALCLDPGAYELHTCFTPLLGHPKGEAIDRIATVCKAERIAPEEIVFLDLETTGLSMTPMFLIGTMECTCDGFVFKQYFARGYSEEAGILSAFSERLGAAQMIITFNGKSFDVPFLQNRAIATGVKLPKPKSHLDLLHEARRHYGRTLPNHKLQTLERIVCGKCREDDIPSALIPAAYHDFVRTGNARKIGSILTHNLHDLLTMADLMHKMWQR